MGQSNRYHFSDPATALDKYATQVTLSGVTESTPERRSGSEKRSGLSKRTGTPERRSDHPGKTFRTTPEKRSGLPRKDVPITPERRSAELLQEQLHSTTPILTTSINTPRADEEKPQTTEPQTLAPETRGVPTAPLSVNETQIITGMNVCETQPMKTQPIFSAEDLSNYDEENQELAQRAIERQKRMNKSIAEIVLSEPADFRDPNNHESPELCKLRNALKGTNYEDKKKAGLMILLAKQKGLEFTGKDIKSSQQHAIKGLTSIIKTYPLLPVFWEPIVHHLVNMKKFANRTMEYLLNFRRDGEGKAVYNWQTILRWWYEQDQEGFYNVFRQAYTSHHPLAVNDRVRVHSPKFVNAGTVTAVTGAGAKVMMDDGVAEDFTRDQINYVLKGKTLLDYVAEVSGVEFPRDPEPTHVPPPPMTAEYRERYGSRQGQTQKPVVKPEHAELAAILDSLT
jgi:hypothetical protein